MRGNFTLCKECHTEKGIIFAMPDCNLPSKFVGNLSQLCFLSEEVLFLRCLSMLFLNGRSVNYA